MKRITTVIIVAIVTTVVLNVIARNEIHEQYLTIPDIVYENIVLNLPDGYTEADVVKYYDTHRVWADSLVIADETGL